MPPRALLLSPDDQAVSAITGVLEELSVLCERPRDGASAAQQLNSQNYDLVLVDCDNLPAAKLIFDVCRRMHAGISIPIAIVDGRAGLPTAFRLGAELILTKPVAKDQARSTIRTAVSRLRKDEPARTVLPLESAAVDTPAPSIPETFAQAAAAAVSVPATTVSLAPPPAPVIAGVPKAIPDRDSAATAAVLPIPIPETKTSTREKFTKASSVPASPPPKMSHPSEDPALAELTKAETELQTPVFASFDHPRKPKKGRGALLALVVLGMLGAGFYAAWMLQPDFRAMVQPPLDKAIALMGMLRPQPQTTVTAPRPAQPVAKTSEPHTPAPTQSVSATPTVTTSGTENASQPVLAAPSATNSKPEPNTSLPAPAAKGDSSASNDSEAEKSSKSAGTTPEAELPWEKETVILSSKGAEKRLIHHVQPAFPREARAQKTDGTVVLKTLVSENGSVEGMRVVEGNPALAPAATKAVKQWRYKPYLRDGNRTAFQTIVIVDFQQP